MPKEVYHKSFVANASTEEVAKYSNELGLGLLVHSYTSVF